LYFLFLHELINCYRATFPDNITFLEDSISSSRFTEKSFLRPIITPRDIFWESNNLTICAPFYNARRRGSLRIFSDLTFGWEDILITTVFYTLGVPDPIFPGFRLNLALRATFFIGKAILAPHLTF
jgi:hypothetical protein